MVSEPFVESLLALLPCLNNTPSVYVDLNASGSHFHIVLQFVASTEDWRSLRAFGLAYHANVSVATYPAPYSEARLRRTINGYRGAPLHAVLETFFNIRDFSDAMLTDRRLSRQVQVNHMLLPSKVRLQACVYQPAAEAMLCITHALQAIKLRLVCCFLHCMTV